MSITNIITIIVLHLRYNALLNLSDVYSILQLNKFIFSETLEYHGKLVLIEKIKMFKIIPSSYSVYCGVTDREKQVTEYSIDFYQKFFNKNFDKITPFEIAVINSHIIVNTNISSSKQFNGQKGLIISKNYKIHKNGLIKQIPTTTNYVIGFRNHLEVVLSYVYLENEKISKIFNLELKTDVTNYPDNIKIFIENILIHKNMEMQDLTKII